MAPICRTVEKHIILKLNAPKRFKRFLAQCFHIEPDQRPSFRAAVREFEHCLHCLDVANVYLFKGKLLSRDGLLTVPLESIADCAPLASLDELYA